MKTLKRFLVIAALALFTAGCSQEGSDEAQASLGGIRLSIGEAVRTALPTTFNFDSFEVIITPDGENALPTYNIDGDDLDDTIELTAGGYSLTLKAYINDGEGDPVEAATGSVAAFTVAADAVKAVQVNITFASLEGAGTLAYAFTDNSNIADADSTLAKTITWIPLSAGGTATSWPPAAVSGDIPLNAGYYLVSAIVDTWKEEAAASEVVHIYNGQKTAVTLEPANKYAKKAWLAGTIPAWTFPGTEMDQEDYGVYAWEGGTTATEFRIYVEDTSTWADNKDKGRRIQPSGADVALTVGTPADAVFNERNTGGTLTYHLPENGYYKIAFDASTMKVTATKPVIFEGITVADDSAACDVAEQTVHLTAEFAGKNLPDPLPVVTWSAVDKDGTEAAISSAGVLTIPAATPVGDVFTVTASATINEVTKTDTATVTILAAPPEVTGITVTATSGVDDDGETPAGGGHEVVFTAVVTGDAGVPKTVTWAVGNGQSQATATGTDGEGNPTFTLNIWQEDKGKTITVTATSTVTDTVSDSAELFVKKYGDVYLIGTDWADSWDDQTKGLKLDYDGLGVYSIIATITKDSSFRFREAAGGHFAPTVNDSASTGTMDASYYDTTNNAWKAPDYGSYTISLDTQAEEATFSSSPVVISVAVEPKTASVHLGATKNFTATVVGTAGQTVAWTVTGANHTGTTISEAGLLTVDAAETASSLTIKATATEDADKFDTAEVTISESVGVDITLSIEDKGAGLTLTKDDEEFTNGSLGTISKTGTPKTITVAASTPDYTYDWVINGNYAGKQAGTSITLDAADYPLGGYSLTLIATKEGIPWSFAPMSFTVEK